MTREDAKREILFAKRNVVADSWIDKAYDMAIQALSEPEPHWIPCSERLPEEEGKCLVTDAKTVDIDIFTHSGNGTPMWFLSDNVTAWMPLPQPYREDGEQDDS